MVETDLQSKWTASKPRPARILIAGLGNSLLTDDGVGVHAVRAVQAARLPGVIAADIGVAVLDALHLFEWAEKVIAVDAMQAGGAPGTVYRFGLDDLAEDEVAVSLHQVSLRAALRFAPAARPAITIIGVEPLTIEYGLDLSPPVAAALPQVVAVVGQIVAGWRAQQ